jgi:hypothetical protein
MIINVYFNSVCLTFERFCLICRLHVHCDDFYLFMEPHADGQLFKDLPSCEPNTLFLGHVSESSNAMSHILSEVFEPLAFLGCISNS